MPTWAESLQRIGAMAASGPATGRRTTVAIAVPTRSYAAVLVALGVVLGRSRVSVVPDEMNEHFAQICALPRGTRVWVTVAQRRHKGLVMGLGRIDGQPFVKIQLTTGDRLTIHVGERNATSVEIDEWDGALPSEKKGKRIIRRPGFLEAAFAGLDPRDFGIRSRMDAVIIGSVASLRTEIMNTSIGARLPNGRLVYGTFQDLLRSRRLAQGQAFRSDIVSDTTPDFSALPTESNCTAVFDGARPFIKWHDAMPSASQVVVLDRTAHSFQDAADIVNQQYLRRSADIRDFQRIPGIPWGMEVMAYEEAAL